MKHFYIILILFMFGCKKETPKRISPYFVEVYPEILADVDLVCVPDSSEYYISADINDVEVCHYEGQAGRQFNLGISSKFSTPSPNSGGPTSNARQGCRLSLSNLDSNHLEFFKFEFPDFEVGRNKFEYLDSIFAIPVHEILGKEDVFIPECADIVEEATLKAGSSLFLNKILITLNSKDITNDMGGGSTFVLSTIFGEQEGSFFKLNSVRKTMDDDYVYYEIEGEFECKLYHWPQYGIEGLWGDVKNGKFNAKGRIRR